MKTDHSAKIADLRERASGLIEVIDGMHERGVVTEEEIVRRLAMLTAADLLEIHDDTGLSLDDWPFARALVEHFLGEEIQENHV